jgi:hypothetical protein
MPFGWHTFSESFNQKIPENETVCSCYFCVLLNNIFSASISENLTFTTAVSISTPSAPELVEPCYPTLFSLDFFARYPASNLPTKLDNAEFSAAEATSASLQCNCHLRRPPPPWKISMTCHAIYLLYAKKRLLCLSMMKKLTKLRARRERKNGK